VGRGGGIEIDNAEVGLDEFTVAHVTNNTASTSGPNLFGPYVIIPDLPSLPGDYNNDGFINAADYTAWRNHLGEPDESGIHFGGDGGGVTHSDYTWWKEHYGNPGSGGATGLSSAGPSTDVPEPASLVLAALGVFGPFFRVRRANHSRRRPVL
jgi:hypothetical protein